jgi:Tfp pilus assembly protein PilX
MQKLRQRLIGDERGIALVMALGILIVSAIMIVTIVDYSSSGQRTSYYSKARVTAFDAADAGMNNAVSVLNNPTQNSLDQITLPACHTPNPDTSTPASTNPSWFGSPTNFTSQSGWKQNVYSNATAYWCGDLDRNNAQWYLWAIGSLKNPTGPNAGSVSRRLMEKVSVTPTLTQPLNNPVWNYMYSGHLGSTCDETFNNNITGASRLYVAGNLCLSPNVSLAQSMVIVGGNLDLSNNAGVGASTNMSTRVETYVGGNCRYGGGSWAACSGNQDARKIFSKLSDGTTIAVNHTPPVVPPPTADYALWYANAIPGPSQPCTTSSGPVPTFDNNTSRDNSVSTVFDLTPSSSYTCRVGKGASTTLLSAVNSTQTTINVVSTTGFPTTSFRLRIDDEAMTVTGGFGTTTWTVARAANGTTAAAHASGQSVVQDDAGTSGELSWNATTKTLTALGTIYIDGSAKVSNGALNAYNGQATLYLSGTFLQSGSLCGGISGSACAFSAWNPNTEMLTIVANGSGGQVTPGDSIQLDNNWSFQGGLFATNNIEFGNNTTVDGPIVGSQILLSNNLATNAFPTITTVPVGMPSNPAVYAQPNPPQGFSG